MDILFSPTDLRGFLTIRSTTHRSSRTRSIARSPNSSSNVPEQVLNEESALGPPELSISSTHFPDFYRQDGVVEEDRSDLDDDSDDGGSDFGEDDDPDTDFPFPGIMPGLRDAGCGIGEDHGPGAIKGCPLDGISVKGRLLRELRDHLKSRISEGHDAGARSGRK